MSKIFLCGDTHRNNNLVKLLHFSYTHTELTENDYVIILGDFGGLWYGDKRDKKWIDNLLKTIKATILWVDGNHENFDVLNEYSIEKWNGGNVHIIRDRLIHLMRGQVFNINENKIFVFGGATSIDKMSRTEGVSWWPQELPITAEINEGLDNLENYDNSVDYILTHCCSTQNILDLFDTNKLIYPEDSLNKYFTYLEKIATFKHWYFGHYHIDKTVNNKFSCLFNNIIELGENNNGSTIIK